MKNPHINPGTMLRLLLSFFAARALNLALGTPATWPGDLEHRYGGWRAGESLEENPQKKLGFQKDLVGGLVAMNFIVPYLGFLIIPIDFHIFQRGGPNHQPDITLHIFNSVDSPPESRRYAATYPPSSARGAVRWRAFAAACSAGLRWRHCRPGLPGLPGLQR